MRFTIEQSQNYSAVLNSSNRRHLIKQRTMKINLKFQASMLEFNYLLINYIFFLLILNKL